MNLSDISPEILERNPELKERKMSRCRWTEGQVEFLFDSCGLVASRVIASSIGRTVGAIRKKLSRHKVSVYSNFYTARLLGTELGRHHDTVMRWYRKGWLKGRVADFGLGYCNRPMVFTESNIVDFLIGHGHLFDWKKIPNTYFKNVVKEQSCISSVSAVRG